MTGNRKLFSAAMLALLAAGAGSGVLLDQFLDEKEGNRNSAYPDGGKVWTICRGLTRIDGRPVTQGMTLTAEQCRHYNQMELEKTLAWVDSHVTVPLTEPQRAGIASFCAYNLGAAKCQRSTFWRRLNAGDTQGACAEIKRWIYDGGRDCRQTKGQKDGCYGQVERREQESALLCWGLDDSQ